MLKYFKKLALKEILNDYGFEVKDIDILEFNNISRNVLYVLHKPTHFIYEIEIMDENICRTIKYRNVTFFFNWHEAIKTKWLPKEFTFWEKCLLFLFLVFGLEFHRVIYTG